MTVVHLVEVPLEDLTVTVTSFELERDCRLLQLARQAAVGALGRVDVHIAGELLRDRATSASREEPRPEGCEVFECRPREATEIDARIAEEARIFRRDSRRHKESGDVVERNGIADALQRVGKLV